LLPFSLANAFAFADARPHSSADTKANACAYSCTNICTRNSLLLLQWVQLLPDRAEQLV